MAANATTTASGPRSLSARALSQPPGDQRQYGKLLAAAYRLGMDSGPAVSLRHATTRTVVELAPGETLAETRARCQAAITAANATVRRAQAALILAQERLHRAQDAEKRFRARRSRKMPAA